MGRVSTVSLLHHRVWSVACRPNQQLGARSFVPTFSRGVKQASVLPGPRSGKSRLAAPLHSRSQTHCCKQGPEQKSCSKPGVYNGAGPAQRFAVVGGGFAGVATAWHLLQLASKAGPVHIEHFDAAGLGAGASGAAAGILHPFNPRGKIGWRGEEAFAAALELVEVAEKAAAVAATRSSGPDEAAPLVPFVWRQRLLRPAADLKQARDLGKAGHTSGRLSAQPIGSQEAAALLQGLSVVQLPDSHEGAALAAATNASLRGVGRPEVHAAAVGFCQDAHTSSSISGSRSGSSGGSTSTVRREELTKEVSAEGVAAEGVPGEGPSLAAALLVEGGLVLHPERYIRAVWEACQQAAAGCGSSAILVRERVASLAELEAARGPYTAVIVAAGAAVGTIFELGARLPLSLVQGHTLSLTPPEAHHVWADGTSGPSPNRSARSAAAEAAGAGYPADAPSLLGQPYIAAQGAELLVVGATKQRGYTAEQAFQECGREVTNAAEVAAAAAALQGAAARVWAPAGWWRVGDVKTGVRAMPQKTNEGALPLAGRISHRWWVVAGLGARGLLYHAWLGQQVAAAVAADDEGLLAPQLRRWQDPGRST